MYRSTDDLRDFESSNDGDSVMEVWNRPSTSYPNRDPSPSTAALLAPAGCLTQAPVSRTKDGKPRVMDLNNLGLRGRVPQRQPSPSKYETLDNKWAESGRIPGSPESPLTHTRSRNGRQLSHHPDSSIHEGLKWPEEINQGREDGIARRPQGYINDKSSLKAPVDQRLSRYEAAMSISNQPVPPSGSFPGCGQEQVRRFPGNQSQYYDTTRLSNCPLPVNARHEGDVHTDGHVDKIGMYTNTSLKQEVALLQQSRQRTQPEILRPINFTPQATAPKKAQFYQTKPHMCNTNSELEYDNSAELELDERRQKLMIKKKGVPTDGKRHKKHEKKVPVVEKSIAAGRAVKENTPQIVPRPPTTPQKAKENGGGNYSKRKRRLISRVQNNAAESCYEGNQPKVIPRQTPRQTMCWSNETASGSQRLRV